MVFWLMRSILLSLLFISCAYGQAAAHIGSTSISIPPGWIELRKESDVGFYRAEVGFQNATLSSQKFQKPISFEEFKKFCDDSVGIAQHGPDGFFIQSETSSRENNVFRCFYTVENDGPKRISSGYLAQKDNELIKIEFVSYCFNNDPVNPAEHLGIFKMFSSKVFSSENAQQ